MVDILLASWFWESTALIVITSALCALVGSFILLRKMSLLADAVSHSVLPGVVGAYLLVGYHTVAFLLGAVMSGLLCVWCVGFLLRHTRLKEDAATGVVFSSLFALGIVLVSRLKTVDLDPACVVFGEAMAARPGSLWLASGLLLLASVLIVLFFKTLSLGSFDPLQARLQGLPERQVHTGLLVMLALTTVAALRAVGLVLAIAFLITPAATAFVLTRRLRTMLGCALGLAVIESVVGMVLAVWLNVSPSGLIAALALLVLISVLTFQTLAQRVSGTKLKAAEFVQ